MKNTIALIIKLLVTFAAAWIAFSVLDNLSILTVAIIAVSCTVLNYVLGDLLILPRFGNTIATIMDGILAAITAYFIIILIANVFVSTSALMIFVLMVAVFEIFFHMYLLNANIVERRSSRETFNNEKLNYNTETANELYPYNKNSYMKDYEISNYSDDNGDNRYNINRKDNDNIE